MFSPMRKSVLFTGLLKSPESKSKQSKTSAKTPVKLSPRQKEEPVFPEGIRRSGINPVAAQTIYKAGDLVAYEANEDQINLAYILSLGEGDNVKVKMLDNASSQERYYYSITNQKRDIHAADILSKVGMIKTNLENVLCLPQSQRSRILMRQSFIQNQEVKHVKSSKKKIDPNWIQEKLKTNIRNVKSSTKMIRLTELRIKQFRKAEERAVRVQGRLYKAKSALKLKNSQKKKEDGELRGSSRLKSKSESKGSSSRLSSSISEEKPSPKIIYKEAVTKKDKKPTQLENQGRLVQKMPRRHKSVHQKSQALQINTPVSKRSKTPASKRSKTPDSKRSKTPASKRSKTPASKRSKTPASKRSKTPDSKRSKTPDSKSKTPDSKVSKTSFSMRSKTPDSKSKTPDSKVSKTSFLMRSKTPDVVRHEATETKSPFSQISERKDKYKKRNKSLIPIPRLVGDIIRSPNVRPNNLSVRKILNDDDCKTRQKSLSQENRTHNKDVQTSQRSSSRKSIFRTDENEKEEELAQREEQKKSKPKEAKKSKIFKFFELKQKRSSKKSQYEEEEEEKRATQFNQKYGKGNQDLQTISNSFSLQERQFKEQYDIVFVLDTTASMKKSLPKVIPAVNKIVSNISTIQEISTKFACVSYTDHQPDDGEYGEPPVKYYPHDTLESKENKKQVLQFIEGLQAKGGGGNGGEAVVDALHCANNKVPFREGSEKIFILILDQGPHGLELAGELDQHPKGCPCGLDWKNELKQMNEKDVEFLFVKCGDKLKLTEKLFEEEYGNKWSVMELDNFDKFDDKIANYVCGLVRHNYELSKKI